ncbi:hypothetical protein LY76DRAFT_605333 [Colletotrichum caudatum]|nr:hypothetical protein LY76DRAFT_605333 [Colletotrichum caudatum]
MACPPRSLGRTATWAELASRVTYMKVLQYDPERRRRVGRAYTAALRDFYGGIGVLPDVSVIEETAEADDEGSRQRSEGEEDVDSLPLVGTGPDPRRTVMPLDMIIAGRGYVLYLNGIHDDARTLWLLKPSTPLVFISASTTDKAGVLPAIRLSGGSAALAMTFT